MGEGGHAVCGPDYFFNSLTDSSIGKCRSTICLVQKPEKPAQLPLPAPASSSSNGPNLGCSRGGAACTHDLWGLVSQHQQAQLLPLRISVFPWACLGMPERKPNYSNLMCFFTSILRYNLHTTKFIHCKSTIQWFLVNLYLCNHHQNSVLEHFHHPEKFPCARELFITAATPAPADHDHSGSLSLLLWTPCTWNYALCGFWVCCLPFGMVSLRFICAAAQIGTLVFYCWIVIHYMGTARSVNPRLSGLLQFCDYHTPVDTYVPVFVWTHFHFSWVYSLDRLLSHVEHSCLTV